MTIYLCTLEALWLKTKTERTLIDFFDVKFQILNQISKYSKNLKKIDLILSRVSVK